MKDPLSLVHKLILFTNPVSASDLSTIGSRIDWIRCNRPKGIPRILEFGWTHSTRHTAPALRLVTEYCSGVSLYRGMKRNLLSSSDKRAIHQNMNDLLDSWRDIPFVHGDLSARNLIYHPHTQKLYAVDWLLNLNSYSGTPRFAAPAVKSGRHTITTDTYAAHQIMSLL